MHTKLNVVAGVNVKKIIKNIRLEECYSIFVFLNTSNNRHIAQKELTVMKYLFLLVKYLKVDQVTS